MKEAVFSPCFENKAAWAFFFPYPLLLSEDWVKAGFLPLLDSSLTGVPPIPKWTKGICSLKEQPAQALERPFKASKVA